MSMRVSSQQTVGITWSHMRDYIHGTGLERMDTCETWVVHDIHLRCAKVCYLESGEMQSRKKTALENVVFCYIRRNGDKRRGLK